MASGPITSWQIDGETMETERYLILLGSKITADGDCSHEIKRHLLLGRKVMINWDSILKSRDINFLAKVHIVKAMVFPVVMYMSWTIVQFSSAAQSGPTLCNPWIAARQASLSITNSRSSLRLTSIESVMPSSHLILCHPLLSCPQSLPASGSFLRSQFFTSGGQSIEVSALASVLPMNIQDWFPLGWTGWISLHPKGLKSLL